MHINEECVKPEVEQLLLKKRGREGGREGGREEGREGDNNILVSVVHGDRVLGCRLWEIIFLEEATVSNPCILHCMY